LIAAHYTCKLLPVNPFVPDVYKATLDFGKGLLCEF